MNADLQRLIASGGLQIVRSEPLGLEPIDTRAILCRPGHAGASAPGS